VGGTRLTDGSGLEGCWEIGRDLNVLEAPLGEGSYVAMRGKFEEVVAPQVFWLEQCSLSGKLKDSIS
jgi:hypothetical protein